MLFGAVAWYCSLVPYQIFSQQDAYEALSRYKFDFTLYGMYQRKLYGMYQVRLYGMCQGRLYGMYQGRLYGIYGSMGDKMIVYGAKK